MLNQQVIVRNVAGQSIDLMAVDTATGGPKTGDTTNLTAYVELDKDGSLVALTGPPTQISATNKPGIYRWGMTQAETDGRELSFSGKSSTSGIILVPFVVQTTGTAVMQDIWDYMAESPWNLIAIINRIRYGVPAVTLFDKANFGLSSVERTATAAAVLAAVQTSNPPVPSNWVQANGHPVSGDGSQANPIIVTP